MYNQINYFLSILYAIMADNLLSNIEGLSELLNRLESVSQDLKKKGGRFALRKAATIVMKAAKSNSQNLDDPDTGRKISDNISLRWDGKRFKRTGDLSFRVGVLYGARLPRSGQNIDAGALGPTPHWRLLEFGTEKMQARPFMRRALEENLSIATQTFVAEYKKAIERALRRQNR
jgi:HK97 gp10 family phage protein